MLAQFLDQILILTSDFGGDIKKVVEYSLIVINLNNNCKDILDYRCQLSKFHVIQLGLSVQISFQFIEEIMRPSHLLQY
jgi:hypothetical protein